MVFDLLIPFPVRLGCLSLSLSLSLEAMAQNKGTPRGFTVVTALLPAACHLHGAALGWCARLRIRRPETVAPEEETPRVITRTSGLQLAARGVRPRLQIQAIALEEGAPRVLTVFSALQ